MIFKLILRAINLPIGWPHRCPDVGPQPGDMRIMKHCQRRYSDTFNIPAYDLWLLNGLKMCLMVLVKPNASFTEIRDNYCVYFLWSVGLTVASMLPFVAFVAIFPYDITQSTPDELFFVPVPYAVSIAVTYLLGRYWGGNQQLRRAITTLFYANAIIICFAFFVLFFLMLAVDGLTDLSEFHLSEFITTFVVSLTLLVAILIYHLILVFKAIRRLNNFSLGKTFVVWLAYFFSPILISSSMSPYLP